MFNLMLFAYVTAIGFVASAVLSSGYQLVTARPPAFAMPSAKVVACFATGVSFALVGPYIVARLALRARLVERKPAGWLVAGFAVSSLWSACSGILVLDLALSLRHSLL